MRRLIPLLILPLLLNPPLSVSQSSANEKLVIAVDVVPIKGAEDVVGFCRSGVEAELRRQGFTIVDASSNPMLTVRILIDDIFVSIDDPDNVLAPSRTRYVPVATFSMKVINAKQFKHPVFTHPILLTGQGSGAGSTKVRDMCERVGEILNSDSKEYWK